MVQVLHLLCFVSFLLFSELAEGFPNQVISRCNAAEALTICRIGITSDEETTIESTLSASEEEIEQRNLRFGGVGRLYTNPTDETSETEPHITVVERLTSATVLVVGLGGVGSWSAEALCRSGVGNLVLVDLDDICISNTNRQLHALSTTVGRFKIDEMKCRLLDINPQCNVKLIHNFVSTDNVDEILSSIPNLSACLDAIDGSKAKSALLAACARQQIPTVTCGGTAGRTDPTKLLCDDLTKASGDRLLTTCKRNLRKFYGFEQGVAFRDKNGNISKPPRKWNIKSVFSTEPAKVVPSQSAGSSLRRCDGALGTACFVTGTAGFIAAGEVVDMIANNRLVAPTGFKR